MALTVLGVLLVGPLFMALSAAKDAPMRASCMAEMGCDSVKHSFPQGG